MLAEWAARPSQPIQLTSTNQKTLFAPVNLSLTCFTKYIKVPMNPVCANIFKPTIMWCHMATMALRGLTWIIPTVHGLQLKGNAFVFFYGGSGSEEMHSTFIKDKFRNSPNSVAYLTHIYLQFSFLTV
jgi:hypothetical protein